MTYKDIKHNEEVNELLKKGNQNLGLLGYTDHSQAHCVRVAETAAHILKKFGYPEHDIELARIAGYMHDIGNAINRSRHAEYGGLLANEILKQYDLSIPDRITICLLYTSERPPACHFRRLPPARLPPCCGWQGGTGSS